MDSRARKQKRPSFFLRNDLTAFLRREVAVYLVNILNLLVIPLKKPDLRRCFNFPVHAAYTVGGMAIRPPHSWKILRLAFRAF